MKILIVSKDPTHPTIAGNRHWILAQSQKLESLGHEVHFLYVQEMPLRNARKDEYEEALTKTRNYWGNRFHLYNVPTVEKIWFNILYRLRMAFFNWVEGIDDNYPSHLSVCVKRLNSDEHFNLCIVNYYYLTKLLTDSSIPVNAVFTHDRFADKDKVVGEPILHISKQGETRAMRRADAVIAIQRDEAEYFRSIAPGSRVYTFFAHYDYHPQPVCNNHALVFLSGNNRFNINGLKWFIKVVFPTIKSRFPDASLIVGGSICNYCNLFPAVNGIEYVGYVDDVAEFYSMADVAINPVYQGTGLKIKTFEAVSYDKVTIVHPHSIQGIYDPSHAPVFVADDVAGWVSHLETVWGDVSVLQECKRRNAYYMEALSQYVDGEYDRFLEDSKRS